MTRQAVDTVFYLGRTYTLADSKGVGMFQPGQHGVRVSPWYRKGCVSEYEIVQGKFFLSRISGSRHPILREDLPDLFGIQPSITDSLWFEYEGLQEFIRYDGGLLLIQSELSEMEGISSVSAWTHAEVLELILEQGVVTNSHCRKTEVRKLRNLILNDVETDELEKYIRDSFIHDYAVLRPIRLRLVTKLPPRDETE